MNTARLMIVEDEFIVASDIRQTLTGYGYEVVAHETSGEEALARAAELSPDLVLMDIVLRGELNGIETANELKKRQGTPVIFLTSYADTETLERAKLAAPFGFLVKPFKDRELRATIETALHRVRLERELQAREVELLEANRLLEAVFSSTDVLLAYLDRDFNFIRVNRAYAEAGRRAQDEFPGKNHFDLYPDEGNEQIFRQVVDTGLPYAVKAKAFQYPDQPERGTTYWDWSLAPVKDTEGRVAHLVLSLSDVTGKTHFALAVQKAGRELQAIIDSVPSHIFMKDTENNFLRVNRSFAESLGLTPLEVVGRSAGEFFPVEAAAKFLEEDRQVIETGRPKQASREQTHTKDGDKYYSTDRVPLFDDDGKATRVLGVATDVTPLVETEKRLRESEERYRIALENANDAFALTRNGKVAHVNPKFLEVFGYGTVEEVLGRPVADFVHPEDREWVVERNLARESGQDVTGRYEFKGLRRDNTFMYVEVSSSAAMFRGEPVNLAFLRDITRRREDERKLQETRDRLQAVVDSIEAIVYVADMETHEILLINEYTRRIFGDVEGGICWQALQRDQTAPCTFCTNARLLDNTGEPSGSIVWEVENTLNRRLYECRDRAIRWFDGRLVRLEIATDITDRKLMEQEAQKARNLESLGVLAGGIAHDFNNLLTTVLGNIELVKIYTGPQDRVRTWLDEAVAATDGARQLTNQLLTFSRGGVPVRDSLQMRDVVAQACAFALSGANVKCDIDFPEDIWLVKADRRQISQVFHNLAMNAREALPEGGTIAISGRNVELAEPNDLRLRAGRYVEVEMMDNGQGIPPDILPRIFDPYYSTKPMGASKGTGLGLAICYSIVRKHEGQILLTSKVGEGTVARVLLPALSAEPEEKSASTSPLKFPGGRKEQARGRLLLMEDDEAIIRVTGEIFRHLEFEFEVAREGEDAVELYRRAQDEGRRFDAVILDLTVRGGMGALGTIEKLRVLDPEVRAVVSSGYGDDPVIQRYANYGFRAALVKPYRVHNVKEVLEKILPEFNPGHSS